MKEILAIVSVLWYSNSISHILAYLFIFRFLKLSNTTSEGESS